MRWRSKSARNDEQMFQYVRFWCNSILHFVDLSNRWFYVYFHCKFPRRKWQFAHFKEVKKNRSQFCVWQQNYQIFSQLYLTPAKNNSCVGRRRRRRQLKANCWNSIKICASLLILYACNTHTLHFRINQLINANSIAGFYSSHFIKLFL